MTFPAWMLLGFAVWTLVLLLFTVGIYRWSRILTGRQEIRNFQADEIEGKDWYRRAMRAHANCVENLPVFAVLVFALHAGDVSSPAADVLSGTILAARIVHSIMHIAFTQTNLVTSIRFAFFLVQLLGFFGLAGIVLRQAL